MNIRTNGFKFIDMKKLRYIFILALGLAGFGAQAQFDDLYYDPSSDDDFWFEDNNDGYDDEAYDYYYEDNSYNDYDEYDYWSDYDYYYTSRLRRFHRPYVRVGFYNSWFTNSLFYDPFDYYNPWGGSYFSFSYGSPYWSIGYSTAPWGWNSWNNRGWNSWGYNSWGWNGWNSWGSYNPYCPPGYYGGGYYRPGYANNVRVVNTYSQTSNPKGGYYGSRRSGSTSSSVKGVSTSPRVAEKDDKILNPAQRGNATTGTDGQLAGADTEQRSPRRSTLNNDVQYLSERGDSRRGNAVSERYEGNTASTSPVRRPTRRSVNPSSEPRSYDNTRRSAGSSTQGSNTSQSTRRNSYNNSTYERSNSSSTRSSSYKRNSSSRSSSPTRSTYSPRSSSSRSSGGNMRSSGSSSRSSSGSSRSSSRSSSPRKN